jgi:hypothetical protein
VVYFGDHGSRVERRQLGMTTLAVLIGEFNYFEPRDGRYKSETQNEKQKRQ